MAEEALKKLEEQLNCSVCLDTYTDPKLLQCFHAYCKECLIRLVVKDQQGQLSLTCPTCRQVTPVPDRGVAGLQSAFHINHLLEIQDSFQKIQNSPAILESEKVSYNCLVHDDKELELYCETCGQLICFRCIMKGSEHHSHDYGELNQALAQYKEEVTSLLEPMEKHVAAILTALVQLDRRCGEISDQRVAIKENIHTTFGRLREVLSVREIQLIGQLDQTTEWKLKGLAAQKDQIETTLTQVTSCIHFMRESLEKNEPCKSRNNEILKMKATIIRQVKELPTVFEQNTLTPNTEADITFSVPTEVTTLCEKYGRVLSPSSADPSNCHAITQDIVEVGEKCMAILQAINYKYEPCQEPIQFLECELSSEITGSTATCSVEKRGQSQYAVHFQPMVKGTPATHQS